MGRTNKQEAARVERFTAEAKALIEEQGRNVNDFDFDQGSDEIEKLVEHLKNVGDSNAADDSAGTESKTSESPEKVDEAQDKDSEEDSVSGIEADARAKAEQAVADAVAKSDEIIAAAEERAKVIIAEASHHAQRIINEAKTQAGAKDDAAKVAEIDPANLKEYRNTGEVNLFTEAGRCLPGGKVRLTEDEAENYPALDEIGEDYDSASEVEDTE